MKSINETKYNKYNAFAYLNKKWHQVRIQKILRLIQQYKNSKEGAFKALDIGCGNGKVTEKIKDLGIEGYGIDISSELLKKAEARGIKTEIGDAHKSLPYKCGYFDIVFAGEVIEHIMDPRQFVIEVNRILKPGGLFILTTPNLAGFDNRIRLLFGRVPRCIEPLSGNHYQHVRPFTYRSLKEFLERGGFIVNSLLSNRIKLGFGNSYKLADLFPSLGATLIVEAIKKSDVKTIKLNES